MSTTDEASPEDSGPAELQIKKSNVAKTIGRWLVWVRTKSVFLWRRLDPIFRACAVTVLLSLVVAAAFYWVIRSIAPPDESKRLDPQYPIQFALWIAGGIGGVVALVVAYRRQKVTEESIFVERFGAAAAQLGAEDPAVRMAGVYAMAGVADEGNSAQRQQCVDVLCGYLRLPYNSDGDLSGITQLVIKKPGQTPNSSSDETTIRYRLHDKEVRTAILRVLAAHCRQDAANSWSLCNIDLSGAVLTDSDFSGCSFHRQVSLAGATFSGVAGFDGATFSGNARFEGAIFSAHAGFDRVTFSGHAWFDGATFSGDALFDEATFSGNARFDEATFSGSAGFEGATFSGSAGFKQAIFSGSFATFNGATFFGNARFQQATFSGSAGFKQAIFSGYVRFDSATFSGNAWFDRATFSESAWFDRATFSGANAGFKRATFSGNAGFKRATFSGAFATFEGATFSGDALFDEATFSGDAHFEGATFSGNAWFAGGTFSGNARFDRAMFSNSKAAQVNFRSIDYGPTDVTFYKTNFGSGVVDFSVPRTWNPGPTFDWDTTFSRKPTNILPVDWPPKVT
jgi:uncharacterized protein YjbI with pentapeptide repeats